MTAKENKKLILADCESFVHQQDAEAVRKQLAADFREHEIETLIRVRRQYYKC
jgi:hypothetical protein